MADVARNKLGIDPAKDLHVRKITCAGEPGASIPTTKRRMEEVWGAKVYDHIGATEIGAWSYECTEQPGGLHVNEAFFLVEIEDLETGQIITEPGKRFSSSARNSSQILECLAGGGKKWANFSFITFGLA